VIAPPFTSTAIAWNASPKMNTNTNKDNPPPRSIWLDLIMIPIGLLLAIPVMIHFFVMAFKAKRK
jgi:hypothetical protein